MCPWYEWFHNKGWLIRVNVHLSNELNCFRDHIEDLDDDNDGILDVNDEDDDGDGVLDRDVSTFKYKQIIEKVNFF